MILQKKSTIAPPNNAQSTKMEIIVTIVPIILIFLFVIILFYLSLNHTIQP